PPETRQAALAPERRTIPEDLPSQADRVDSTPLTWPDTGILLGQSGEKWGIVGHQVLIHPSGGDERLSRELCAPGRREGEAEPSRLVSSWCDRGAARGRSGARGGADALP